MKSLKWRLVLSATNILLAIGMSALGFHEYGADHQAHPEYFYHGNLYYIPPAQIASYCLNIPALVISNLFRNFGIAHLSSERGIFTTQWFFHVYVGYYAAVLIFWWCIGWSLDARRPGRSRWPAWEAAGWGLAAFISLGLAYYGFSYWHSDVLPFAIPLSMVVWGIGLACYFVLRTLRVRSATPVGHVQA